MATGAGHAVRDGLRVDHRPGQVHPPRAVEQLEEVLGLDGERRVRVHPRDLDGRREDRAPRGFQRAFRPGVEIGFQPADQGVELTGAGRGAGDAVAGPVPALGEVLVAVGPTRVDPRARPCDALLARGRELVDDPGPYRLRRAEDRGGADDLLDDRGDPEHAGGADESAAARHQPHRHLGQAPEDVRRVEADPVVAGQPELEAATERGAGHRGGHGDPQRLQPAQLVADRDHEPVRGGELVQGDLADLDVLAGEERPLRRGEHDPPDLVTACLDLVEARPEPVVVPLVDHVGRAAGVVEDDRDDPLGVQLPPHRAPPVCHCRSSGPGSVTIRPTGRFLHLKYGGFLHLARRSAWPTQRARCAPTPGASARRSSKRPRTCSRSGARTSPSTTWPSGRAWGSRRSTGTSRPGRSSSRASTSARSTRCATPSTTCSPRCPPTAR